MPQNTRQASQYMPRSWNWVAKKCKAHKTVVLFCICLIHLMNEAGVEAGAGNNIEQTPSWKIGIFFSIFLVLSIILEFTLEYLEEYLHHHKMDGVKMTVEKIKEELMLMGFISLCLLIVEDYLVEWCLPNDASVGIPSEQIRADGDWVCEKYHDPTSEAGKEYAGLAPSGPQWPYCSCYANSSSSAASSAASARMLGSATGSGAKCELNPGMKEQAIKAGASNYGSASSRMLLGGANYECKGCNEVYFIDLKALHEAHTMIFVIAVIHITYSCVVMAISSSRMEKWTHWENLGRDSEGHVLSKEATMKALKALRMPNDHGQNPYKQFCCACGEQFYIGVDSFTFIALRKYYIAKHDLEKGFEFHGFLKKGIHHDFAEMLGLRWWMYLLLVAQVTLEGFGVGNLGIFNWIGLVVVFSAGAKLQAVCSGLALAIHNKYDADGDGEMDYEELQALQAADDETFDEVNAIFWFNKPELLLTMIQYAMWQNSQTLSIALYYFAHIGPDSCYAQQRSTVVVVIQFFFAFLGLFLNSMITVPTYSLVTHMGSASNKMAQLQMHRITNQLKKEGGSMAGAMHNMGARQKATLARMQADGTFAHGQTETMASAIGRMAVKAESLQKAQEKTMKLIDMAAEMTHVDEIERLFGVVCADACDLCGSDRATLFLLDEKTDEVWSIVAQGIPPIRFNKSIGIIGACVSAPTILNIPDAYADARFNKAIDLKSNYKTNNILCVPILHNQTKKCIGAMQIINKTGLVVDEEASKENVGTEESVDFDADDIKIMSSFCKVVANSIVLLQKERRSSIAAGGPDPLSLNKTPTAVPTEHKVLSTSVDIKENTTVDIKVERAEETKTTGPVNVKRNQVAPDPGN